MHRHLDEDALMSRLAHLAVQDALREHKRRGESVVVWQDGQGVCLPPEQIVLDEAA